MQYTNFLYFFVLGMIELLAPESHPWLSFDCFRSSEVTINTLRPRQDDRHFADDIFKSVSLNENVLIWLKISQKFVPKVRIANIPALVQIMAWRQSGDKPLSEPMMVSLLMHICITLPQWIKDMAMSNCWILNHNGTHWATTVAGPSILVPCHVINYLQLIWRSGTHRLNQWVPDLQMSCSDLTLR